MEHGSVDDVGEATLEAAQCFSSGLAAGAFAVDVVGGPGFVAELGDGDRAERTVQASVAASIEPVPFVTAGLLRI